jgi:hypothetical protein
MMVAVPEQFAGGVGRKPKLVDSKGSLSYELISIPEIVNAVHPAKLDSVLIRQHKLSDWTMSARTLNKYSVFIFRLSVLNRPQVFIAATDHKVMLVLFIDSALTQMHNLFHAVIDHGADSQLGIGKVFTFL